LDLSVDSVRQLLIQGVHVAVQDRGEVLDLGAAYRALRLCPIQDFLCTPLNLKMDIDVGLPMLGRHRGQNRILRLMMLLQQRAEVTQQAGIPLKRGGILAVAKN